MAAQRRHMSVYRRRRRRRRRKYGVIVFRKLTLE
jgi:hypothetical protein